MNKLIQRIQSYLATPSYALERLDDLGVELSQRGIKFDIRKIKEDGEEYFYAESVNYPRGYISATGVTIEKLEKELKDAIFTAFEIPVRYCDPKRISFSPPFGSPLSATQTMTAREERYATA